MRTISRGLSSQSSNNNTGKLQSQGIELHKASMQDGYAFGCDFFILVAAG